MNVHPRVLTRSEKLEDALDQLARLREQARRHAHDAGAVATEIFEGLDDQLHEELAKPRPHTAALADVARKLKTLLVQDPPN